MKRLLDHLTMLINYLLLCGILKFVSCKIYLKVFFRVPHQTQACFCRAPNVRRSLNCGLTGPCGVRGQSGPVRSDDRLLFHTLRPSAPLHTENSPTPSQINLTDRPSIWKSFHSLPSTLFLSFFLHFFLLTASFISIYSLSSGSSAVRPGSRQDPRLRSPVVKSTAIDARERRHERERGVSRQMRLTTASNTSASNPVKMCVMPVSAATVCACAVPQESHLLQSAEGHLFSTQNFHLKLIQGHRVFMTLFSSPCQLETAFQTAFSRALPVGGKIDSWGDDWQASGERGLAGFGAARWSAGKFSAGNPFHLHERGMLDK